MSSAATFRWLAAGVALLVGSYGAHAQQRGVGADLTPDIYNIIGGNVAASTNFFFYVDITHVDSLGSPATGVTVDVMFTNASETGVWVDLSGGGSDWSCIQVTGGYSCSYIGSGINPLETTGFKVEAMSFTSGLVDGTANISFVSPFDPNLGNNIDMDSVTITANDQVALRIDNVTALPDPVAPSGTLTYTVDATYYDDLADPSDFEVAATNVTIDILPNDPTVVGMPLSDANWTCGSFRPPTPNISCTLNFPLLPGMSVPQLTQTVTAPTAGTLLQTDFNIFADQIELNPTDNMATHFTTVVGSNASVRLQNLTGTPGTQVMGGPIDYSVDIENFDDTGDPNDGAPATNVHVVFTPSDASASFNVGSGGDWSCGPQVRGPNVIQCDLISGPLPVGNSLNLNVQYFAPFTAGPFDMDVEVFADEVDSNLGDNQGMVPTTIVPPEADMAVTAIVDVPDPVLTDGIVDYTATISNVDSASPTDGAVATGVFVTATLLSGGEITAGGSGDWSCSPGGGARGPVTTYDCSYGPSLPVGDATPLTIQVQAPSTPGTIDLDFVVSANEPDPDFANNQLTEQTTVDPAIVNASMRFETVTDNPDPVIGGDPINYTIEVSNFDDPLDPFDGADATAVTVDLLFTDPEASFGTLGDPNWSCVLSRGPLGGSATCTFASIIPVGVTAPQLPVEVISPTTGGTFTLDMNLSAMEPDNDLSDNFFSEDTTVTPPMTHASLRFDSVTDNPDPVIGGDPINYLVHVANFDDPLDPLDGATATGVTIDVSFTDPEATFGAVGNPDWTCGGQSRGTGSIISCTLNGTLPVGVVAPVLNLEIFSPTSPPTFSVDMNLFGNEFDSDLSDNMFKEDTAVVAPVLEADLAITKSVDDPAPVLGSTVTYFIDVINNGPEPANNVTVIDTLPPGVGSVVSNTPAWTCAPGAGTTFVCSIPVLAPTGAVEFPLELSVVTEATGQQTNTVSVSADEDDPNLANNNDSVDINVSGGGGDLTLTLSDSIDPALVGDAIVYSSVLTNTGKGFVTGVEIGLTFPAQLADPIVTSPGWTCFDGQSRTVAGDLICSLNDDLPAGGTEALDVSVSAVGSGQATVMAEAASAEGDFVMAQETTEIIDDVVDLTINKTVSAGSFAVGEVIDFNIAVVNQGSVAATGVVVTDDLPLGFDLETVSATGWTCQGDPGLTCTRSGPLGAGESDTIVLSGLAAIPGDWTNTAEVSASQSDANPANNVDSVDFDVVATGVDLELKLDASVPQVAVGDSFEFIAMVLNNGPQGATSIQFEAQLSGGILFNSGAGGGWTCAAGRGKGGMTQTCTYGPELPAGASSTLSLQVTAVESGTLTASGVVNASQKDTNPENNGDETQVQAIEEEDVADLALTKAVDLTDAAPGDTLTYAIDVTNLGPDAAAAVRVVDTLPPGLSLTSATGAGWVCAVNGNVTCERPTLAVQETTTLTIVGDVLPDAGSTLTNSAVATADASDPDTGNNSDSATTRIKDPQADLALVKTVSDATVGVDDPFSFGINISNAGPDMAVGVEMIDRLPAGLQIDDVSGGDGACSVTGRTVRCSLPTLAAGTSVDLTINARAGRTGSYTNEAAATATTPDPNEGNNKDSAAIEVVAQPNVADIAVTKTASASDVEVGDEFFYTLAVTNDGPDVATEIELVDVVPAKLDVLNVQSAGFNCALSGQEVRCTKDALFAGLTQQVRIAVRANTAAEEVSNTANATTTSQDPHPDNNSAKATVRINRMAAADLMLTKSADAASVEVGEAFTYTLRAQNLGPDEATDVKLRDVLPVGIELVGLSGDSAGCTAAGRVVNCSFGALASGASRDVLLDVRATQEGSIVNEGVVSSDTADPDPENNNAKAEVAVTARPAAADLALTKSGPAGAVVVGSEFSYRLSVMNNGLDDAAGITMEDKLPSSVQFVATIPGGGWSCTHSGATVSCSRDLLRNGRSSDVLVRVKALEAGTATNQATVSATTPDPDGSNNAASASVVIEDRPGADLAVTKTLRESDVIVGDTLTFDLTVDNFGPATAENVVLVDELPAALTFVSASGATCSGSSEIVCELGNLSAGQQVLVAIVTTAGEEPGAAVNRARVSSDTLDPDPSNNFAVTNLQIEEMPTAESIEESLNAAVPESGSPNQRANIAPIARLCSRSGNSQSDFCRALIRAARDGRLNEVRQAIDQIVPEQVLTQGTSITKLNTTQQQNVSNRLQQIRGGGGAGFSMSGLTFRHGSQSISLGLLQYLGEEEDEAISSSEPDSGLISPWGFFMNGTISAGERDPTTRALGFDFGSYGLTAGFDYRATSTSVLGMALGYADFDSDLADGSGTDTKAWTLTGYGSFYPNENWYIDGRISYGSSEFTQSRRVNFTLGDLVINEMAIGRADGNEFSAALSAGYSLYRDAWTFTPSGSVRYLNADIDPFTETGAGPQNISYGEQEFESILFSANIAASKAISTTRGVVTPQFDLSYHYEGGDDSILIRAGLAGAQDNEQFIIQSDQPDRHYGSAGLGLVFVTSRGRQFFLSYRGLLGLEGTTQHTINFGGRITFQ